MTADSRYDNAVATSDSQITAFYRPTRPDVGMSRGGHGAVGGGGGARVGSGGRGGTRSHHPV